MSLDFAHFCSECFIEVDANVPPRIIVNCITGITRAVCWVCFEEVRTIENLPFWVHAQAEFLEDEYNARRLTALVDYLA